LAVRLGAVARVAVEFVYYDERGVAQLNYLCESDSLLGSSVVAWLAKVFCLSHNLHGLGSISLTLLLHL
jgi:hypothetical protein